MVYAKGSACNGCLDAPDARKLIDMRFQRQTIGLRGIRQGTQLIWSEIAFFTKKIKILCDLKGPTFNITRTVGKLKSLIFVRLFHYPLVHVLLLLMLLFV